MRDFDASPTDAVVAASRGKKRPPDPALDELLARIETCRHTTIGAEMYARAERRTLAEAAAIRDAHPVFGAADGMTAYGALGRG